MQLWVWSGCQRGAQDLSTLPPCASHLLILRELHLNPVSWPVFPIRVFSLPTTQAAATLWKRDDVLMDLEPFHLERVPGSAF